MHAISPGPIRTRAASGLAEFDALIADATAMLAADHARLLTGTTLSTWMAATTS